MATTLAWEELGEALGSAGTVLRANASSSGLETSVPTCPGWTVRDLVVHQGKVHRWATDVLAGRGVGDGVQHERAGNEAADLLEWFDQGWANLLHTLGSSAEDLDVPFLWPTGDAPRIGWARRQAHETSIHAADALAARLGRPPAAEETWLKTPFAVDGIDELLTGFVAGRPYGDGEQPPRAIAVIADDGDRSWTAHVGPDPTRVAEGTDPAADVRFHGNAVDLYLALWGRGGDIGDEQGHLPTWHEQVAISW